MGYRNVLTPASTCHLFCHESCLGRSLLAQFPFLCNFRANFAAATCVGKATNAGQALVLRTLRAAYIKGLKI